MNGVSYRHRRILRENLIRLSGALLSEAKALLDEGNVKRIWTREWLKRREERGASSNLLRELEVEDAKEYQMCLRMTPANFEKLLELVTPKIRRIDTSMRDAIPAKVKLQITLNFLATGNSYRTLQHLFRVSKPAISLFIPEVCDAIYTMLTEYIKVKLVI